MKRALELPIFAVCLIGVGCAKTKLKTPPTLQVPIDIEVSQRSSKPLPGSESKVLLMIDDVTRGQVVVEIAREDGSAILDSKSLRENEKAEFSIGDEKYQIEVTPLANKLIGDDKAVFRIDVAGGESKDEVKRLIESLRELEGATFIRNGREHEVEEAVNHLTRKRRAAGSKIATAEDFIEQLGSKSSTTGRPYLIRLADGKEVETGAWFTESLERLRK